MSTWSTAYQNDLSDASFLYIESGGPKDAEGRTVPRSLRHFPYKDASGKIDLPHLRNAIAQAPKAKLPAKVIADVQAHARRLLDEQSSKAVTKALAMAMALVLKAAAAPTPLGNLTTSDLPAMPPAMCARCSARTYKADAVASPEPMMVHGLTVVIDRPAGFVQTKTDESGAVLWTREYTTPYGYIDDTAGGDGEELDVFVGPAADSTAAYWFCVCTDAGEFDEYKVVLCVESEEQACAIMLAHIPERFVMPGCVVGDVGQIKALLGQDPAEAAEAIEQVSKALDGLALTNKRSRTRKALDSATAYKGDTVPLPPEMQTHPARTAPISETYDPADVGGWVGVMEPDDGSWIAFVDVNGRCLLWTERDADGGVVGLPYEFVRHDLTLKSVHRDLEEFGPPSQWSGTVASIAGPDRRKAMQDAWGTMSEQERSAVRTVWEKSFVSVKFLAATTKAQLAGELRYVLGIVLEPEVVDGQGEIYSAEEIRKSAWLWMSDFRNIDLQHKLYVNDLVSPVESYLAPMDFAMAQDGTAYPIDQAPEGAQRVLRGTWLLGAVVKDDGLWEQIKQGKFTGWSINGFSKKRPV